MILKVFDGIGDVFILLELRPQAQPSDLLYLLSQQSACQTSSTANSIPHYYYIFNNKRVNMIICISQFEDVQIAGVGFICLFAELPKWSLVVLYDWLAYRNNSALSTYGNEGGNSPSLSFSCIRINTYKHTASITKYIYICAPNNLLSFGKYSKKAMHYILIYS